MIDNNTPSPNIVIGESKGKTKIYKNPVIVVIGVLLLIIIILLVIFAVNRARARKIQSSITTAQYDNNHNLPSRALSQLQQIQGMKMSVADQRLVYENELAAYSTLRDFNGAMIAGEQEYKLTSAMNVSLPLTIAELAVNNNDPKVAILYYEKTIAAMGKVPNKERWWSYSADLSSEQEQLKVLENQ
jgi:hypothetical protein